MAAEYCLLCGRSDEEVILRIDGCCQECSAWERSVTHPAWERKAHIKSQYGLGYNKYCTMYDNQSGGCAICGDRIAMYRNEDGIEVASIDHDHETGDIRGLLCKLCNSGLGFFRDNRNFLISAADYLDKNRRSE